MRLLTGAPPLLTPLSCGAAAVFGRSTSRGDAERRPGDGGERHRGPRRAAVRSPATAGRRGGRVATGAGGGAGGPSTSSPTGAVPGGSAKPEVEQRRDLRRHRDGACSPRTTATTSRRPSRSAAPTNVCRAASVNPVLPPSAPG